jgi:PEP-CTERM motif
MKFASLSALLALFSITASADVISNYTDSLNSTTFGLAFYELTANNSKVITASSFSDGTSTQSALEGPTFPNMFEPNSGVIQLLPGQTLVSAEYDLSYSLQLNVNRNVTDLPGTNKAQTNPNFDFFNDNFKVTLAIEDINNVVLGKINVIAGGSFDLLPFLMDGGPIEAAYESTGVFLATHFRADDVVFTADLSGYDPQANPDRNVTIDYNMREKIFANSSLTLDVSAVPEPGTFGLLALGAAGLLGFIKRRKA